MFYFEMEIHTKLKRNNPPAYPLPTIPQWHLLCQSVITINILILIYSDQNTLLPLGSLLMSSPSLLKVKSFSHVQLFVTPWTIAYEAPPSMGFSRQEYQSRLLFSSPGDLPDPGIKPGSPPLQANALPSEPPEKSLNSPGQKEKRVIFQAQQVACI